jgi:hypothetical protein
MIATLVNSSLLILTHLRRSCEANSSGDKRLFKEYNIGTPGEIIRTIPGAHPIGPVRYRSLFKIGNPADFVELPSGSQFLYYLDLVFKFGAPGEIRTPDHLVRSQVLYPTELRAH